MEFTSRVDNEAIDAPLKVYEEQKKALPEATAQGTRGLTFGSEDCHFQIHEWFLNE